MSSTAVRGVRPEAMATFTAVVAKKPRRVRRRKAPSSRALTAGIVRGSAMKPGAKIAASQSRKSLHAGSKKRTTPSAADGEVTRNAQRIANPASMPIIEAGNVIPKCDSAMRKISWMP